MTKQSKMVDVARRAGVSSATVSKAMNGRGYVSELVKQRVFEAVAALNYQPNGIARSLRSAKTNTIGLILSDIANPFMMAMARSIEDTVLEHGFNLLFSSTGEDPARERTGLQLFVEKQVDGIIVASTGRAAEAIRAVQDRRIPVVVVDRRVPDLESDMVVDDNRAGVKQLLAHLYGSGHQRVGILHGNLDLPTGCERHEGAMDGLKALDLDPDPRLMYFGNFTVQGGHEGTRAFLALPAEVRPTAIMAANNLMAAGAFRALREANLAIPKDMALVSFGELDYYWQLQWPPLTVMVQSPHEMGLRAATLLLQRIQQKRTAKPQTVVLSPKLIVRGSCGAQLEHH